MKTLSNQIAKMHYYELSDFERDVKDYINAIETGSMICIIKSVSKSGMSRVLSFHSFQTNYYRQYNNFFLALGFTETKKFFRINGCGMDMVFHTNYTIIHKLKSLGYIDKNQCDILAQKTPTTF